MASTVYGKVYGKVYSTVFKNPFVGLSGGAFTRIVTVADFTKGVLPTTGTFTFTRASAATYYTSGGVIANATSNEPRFDYNPSTVTNYNSILQARNLSSSPWVLAGGPTVTGGAPDVDGGTLGFTLAGTGGSQRMEQTIPVIDGQVYYVYARMRATNLGNNQHFLRVDTGSTNYQIIVNLTANTVTSSGVATAINPTITALSNGFYRVGFGFTAMVTGGNTIVRVYPTSGGLSVIIDGIQVNLGSTPDSFYVSGAFRAGNGLIRGLLFEEARTNLLKDSYFDNATLTTNWRTAGNATATRNTTVINPYGSAVVDVVMANATGEFYTAQVNKPFAGVTTPTTFWGLVRGTGQIVATVAYSSGGPQQTSSVITLTNDWQQFTYVVNYPTTNTDANFGIKAYGAGATVQVSLFQCEVGEYPTSYIPTTTTAATRGVEGMAASGFGSLNDLRNTLAVDYILQDGAGGTRKIASISANYTEANCLDLNAFAASTSNGALRASNTSAGTVALGAPSTPLTNVQKMAVGFNSVSVSGSLNGAAVISTPTLMMPTGLNVFNFGRRIGTETATQVLCGWLRVVTHVNDKLTDAQLRTITT